MPAAPPIDEATAARRRWMAVLARAGAAEIERRLSDCPPLPAYRLLRGPETGLAMVRGRAGGGGAPFNLGEMSVTRCTACVGDDRVGHAYVAGRDRRQAELAAVLDALLQDDDDRARLLQDRVIAPLAASQQSLRDTTARRAAATRVEFFTMASMRT